MTLSPYGIYAAGRRAVARFAVEARGTAVLEFALGSPLVLAIGLYGLEIANQALTVMKINQIALTLADNASRVGFATSSTTVQLRELDINDVLQGARLQGAGIDLAKNGRVTVSSLEYVQQSYDSSPVQRIHWQRCMGAKSGAEYESRYATSKNAGTSADEADKGTDVPLGVGSGTETINAPLRSGVMYVELNYGYQPIFGDLMVKPRVIRQTASFIVRDKRDFAQVYNPISSPSTPRATCDLHAP